MIVRSLHGNVLLFAHVLLSIDRTGFDRTAFCFYHAVWECENILKDLEILTEIQHQMKSNIKFIATLLATPSIKQNRE